VKQISGKDFYKLLESHGWLLKRVSGSHHVFTKAGQRERVVVPVYGKKPLKTGLLKAQMKIADIYESEL